jgi:large subunit ribosomal protein L31
MFLWTGCLTRQLSLRFSQGYRPPRAPKWHFQALRGSRGFVFFCYTEILERIAPKQMKAGIHPIYNPVNVTCACGHTFQTRSTHKGDIRVEICSSCHPFFTGRQKLIDTAGRVDKFERKYKVSRAAKKALQPQPPAEQPQPTA